MARKSKSSCRRRKHRGGNAANPSSYSSGSTYGMAVVGSGDSQFNRVFNNGSANSNAITGLQGQVAGGRKRRKSKKGGFLGKLLIKQLFHLVF